MENKMMIDYRNMDGEICRRRIDRCEFCVRDGAAWFISDGEKCRVELENIIQVYID